MRTLNIIVSLFLLTGLFSCAEDEGNYDYIVLNTITIDSLLDEYSVDQYDTLKIDGVKLNFALEENADLEYEWAVRGRVISTERNCRGYITEAPSWYDSWLCVTDRTNNLKYYKYFKLTVETPYSKALYILSETADGTAKLSVQRRDKENAPLMNEVFELNNPDLGHLGKKPVQITFDDAWGYRLYVVCQEGERKLLKINPENLLLEQYWDEASIGEGYTGTFVPEYFCNDMGAGMVLSEGKLFLFNYSSNNSLYRPVDGYHFSWVGSNPTLSSGYYWAYDEDSQQFKMLERKTNPLLFDKVTNIDTLLTIGQTYRAHGVIRQGDFDEVMYPVLFDPQTGMEHYYELNCMSDFYYDEEKNEYVSVDDFRATEKMVRPAVMEPEGVCLLSDASYWYVSQGDKLVRYFFSGTATPDDWYTDFKGRVSAMIFDEEQERVFVASCDGAKSYIYELSAVNPNQLLHEPFVVDGKIVSMCAVGSWKY